MSEEIDVFGAAGELVDSLLDTLGEGSFDSERFKDEASIGDYVNLYRAAKTGDPNVFLITLMATGRFFTRHETLQFGKISGCGAY